MLYGRKRLEQFIDALDEIDDTYSDAAISQVGVAARDVITERQRQISVEGWTPAHDDAHGDGSLAVAAACYALGESGVSAPRPANLYVSFWPWDRKWAKFSRDKRRNLVKAGALILAEIERLDRAAISGQKPAEGEAPK